MRLGTILLAGLAACSLQAIQGGNDFRWHARLARGSLIEIKGVNGDILAERSATRDVEVAAAKSARRSDPSEVEIRVVETDEGVTICAVYPHSRNEPANECRGGSGGRMSVRDNDVYVQFTVKVPPGVRFTGRTVNGTVEARSLDSAVEAHTVNGKLRLSTSAEARGSTVNGSIEASLGSVNWEQPLDFHTVNGGITLELPSGANTRVKAETVNGRITTDFPLTVEGRFVGRRLNGTLGNGTSGLSVKTVNGSIELKRRV